MDKDFMQKVLGIDIDSIPKYQREFLKKYIKHREKYGIDPIIICHRAMGFQRLNEYVNKVKEYYNENYN